MFCDNYIHPIPNLYIVPAYHYKIEFAHCVHKAFDEIKPQIIAIESPSSLKEAVTTAVERFPYISVVCYTVKNQKIIYFPIEPSDPFCEAVRLAKEHRLPCEFVDLDLDESPLSYDLAPDSYCVASMGLKTFWEKYCELSSHSPTPLDALRERNMAYHIQKIGRLGKKILLVCSMPRIKGLLKELQVTQMQILGKAVKRKAKVFDLHIDSIRQSSGEIPFLTAVYEMNRGNHQKEVKRERPIAYFPLKSRKNKFPSYWHNINAPLTARPVNKLTIIRSKTFTFQTAQDRKEIILRFLQNLCVNQERFQGCKGIWDRQKLLMRMLFKARIFYEENTGETIQYSHMKLLAKFARNYALITGMLVADLYQFIAAAKGVCDDNFGYEVWDLGGFYPWTDSSNMFKTVQLTPEEIWPGSKKFTLERKYPKLREIISQISTRPREEYGGQWAKEFQRGILCSYPPEDSAIETYGRFLKKKADKAVNEQESSSEPFSTSILDGLDVKETLRNWHKKKLYVKKFARTKSRSGSVVVIFDEDKQERKYTWKMTWLGEHEQESDMAFYSTKMEDKIVGPGIARCEYGGFLLSYPPMRLHEIWTDPFYHMAQTKPEVLLMAAIEYSQEKNIVYIAKNAPHTKWKTFAAKLGKKIVYIPIGQLSPVSIKKLRVFHILSGHNKREIAKNYIW